MTILSCICVYNIIMYECFLQYTKGLSHTSVLFSGGNKSANVLYIFVIVWYKKLYSDRRSVTSVIKHVQHTYQKRISIKIYLRLCPWIVGKATHEQPKIFRPTMW